MASWSSPRNFGFRRFTNLVREGRLRSPVGSALRLGLAVEQDPTAPDFIREASSTAVGGGTDPRNANCGILWYEFDSQDTEGRAAGSLDQDLAIAPGNRMVQVLRGKGAKVWFRNTALDTTEPGLNYPAERAAVTMVTELGTTLAVGNLLGYNATSNQWQVTALPAEAWFVVTSVDNTRAICEAELLF